MLYELKTGTENSEKSKVTKCSIFACMHAFVKLFPTLELASETTIDKVMDPPFKEISDNALLEEVRRLLITESAVLVTKHDQVIGIITKADLLKMF